MKREIVMAQSSSVGDVALPNVNYDDTRSSRNAMKNADEGHDEDIADTMQEADLAAPEDRSSEVASTHFEHFGHPWNTS